MRGVTLAELVLLLAFLGVLLAVAAPRVGSALDRAAVEAAAADIVSAHWSARSLAVRAARRVALDVSSDTIAILIVTAGGDSLWRARPGPVGRGVSLTASRRVVVFGPTGLGWGLANTTLRLSRGGAEAELVTSRLGRLRRVR